MIINNPTPPVSSVSVTTPAPVADNADAQTPVGATGILPALARIEAFNGATFDRARSENEGAGLGALRVIRFSDAIVRAGSAFVQTFTQPAVSGQNPHGELFNPLGSGVFLYVDYVEIQPSVAVFEAQIAPNSAALITAVGAGVNKNIGSPGSKGLVSMQTAAGLLGSPFAVIYVNTTQVSTVKFDPLIRLGPGSALMIQGTVTNQLLKANFHWRENTI